jgi:hypothetical protein
MKARARAWTGKSLLLYDALRRASLTRGWGIRQDQLGSLDSTKPKHGSSTSQRFKGAPVKIKNQEIIGNLNVQI